MNIRDERILLDQKFRRKIIEEIEGTENIRRKERALRKQEVYEDNIAKWVIQELRREFAGDTVNRMINRATNLSVLRPVVNKRARCYGQGVIRKLEGGNESEMKFIEAYNNLVNLDRVMRKADRYVDLHRNAMKQIIPILDYRASAEAGREMFRIRNRILPPYMYDVIPDAEDPEVARVVILSPFTKRSNFLILSDTEGAQGKHKINAALGMDGDRKEQTIADSREDEGQEEKHYVWWSDMFHFTTDEDGKILQHLGEPDNMNPIGRLPFVPIAADQDGHFWAEGGDDLVDGAVLFNKKYTDMLLIMSVQGWGQPVATGKDLPEHMHGGPDHLLALRYKSGDPVPTFTYASSNPPIDAWMRVLEQFLAMYLTTNELAPTTISGKLDASDFPSGIAQLIENSKFTGSLDDKRVMFRRVERDSNEINQKWHTYLFGRSALVPRFLNVPPWTETAIDLEYNESVPIVSEKDRLENYKLRKELGLNSMVELVMKDRDVNEKEAERIVAKIIKDQMARLPSPLQGGQNGEDPEDPNNPNPPVPGADDEDDDE